MVSKSAAHSRGGRGASRLTSAIAAAIASSCAFLSGSPRSSTKHGKDSIAARTQAA
jgi:hypothetical protein